ncbi:MAG: hypothetical protein ACPGUC_02960 [Gammaproteobacteria bacterium]
MVKFNIPKIVVLAATLAVMPSTAGAAAIALQNATSTYGNVAFDIDNTIDGDAGTAGWNVYDAVLGSQAEDIVWETQAVVDIGTATFTLNHNFGGSNILGRFRISYTTDDQSLFADGLQFGGDTVANWVVLDAPTSLSATNGVTLTEHSDNDGSILASNPSSPSTFTVSYDVNVASITGFRLEAMEDPSLPTDGPGQNVVGGFILTEFSVDGTELPAEESIPVVSPLWLMMAGFGLVAVGRRQRARR